MNYCFLYLKLFINLIVIVFVCAIGTQNPHIYTMFFHHLQLKMYYNFHLHSMESKKMYDRRMVPNATAISVNSLLY